MRCPSYNSIWAQGCLIDRQLTSSLERHVGFRAGKSRRICITQWVEARGYKKQCSSRLVVIIRQEYSIFVGDLTPEVDDFELYHYFVKKYASCRGGKVVLDSRGKSRGFGFVRFADEAEQKKALDECQSGKGLGEKPIRISIAVPKSAKSKPEYQPNPSYNYSQYYQQYQNYYSQWGYDPYGSYNYSYPPYGSHEGPNMTSTAPSAEMPPLSEFQQNSTLAEETEEEPVEDPDPKLDVEEINKQFMEQSEELYDSLMNCHWQPLDTITSEIPTAV
ncbi:tRNA selenocysteine 1-associated protein 1-like isoform X3 [Callorhinchus milii]|uniref:tRNA selenocysteine 1-associated protein 1-like isoform X3 n=1 Tax=Callorhinchus milii TaxID=7868 RepID=UPI0004571463|nr:tRNA selenocysteine 1-associated protein 1-like isoform X3 [Callorhinchus milii]|eukprot:gi/632965747/ref/XP_007899045.1/ PREDICTED: putative uncharacterized protein C6orf52 homolog isoform X3 [Callorhinchus milii]